MCKAIKCTTCMDTGKIHCDNCNGGLLDRDCHQCNGTGLYPDDEGRLKSCHSCDGEGVLYEVECEKCDGEGEIDCPEEDCYQ